MEADNTDLIHFDYTKTFNRVSYHNFQAKMKNLSIS